MPDRVREERLETYAFPRIGRMPVSDVTSADVLEILTPIWHVKATTARRVRQRIRAVMEWAIAVQMRTDNPCDRLEPVLGVRRPSSSTCARCPTVRRQRRSRRSGFKLAR